MRMTGMGVRGRRRNNATGHRDRDSCRWCWDFNAERSSLPQRLRGIGTALFFLTAGVHLGEYIRSTDDPCPGLSLTTKQSPLWVPPEDRPIPLEAFPILNGNHFHADGSLDTTAPGRGLWRDRLWKMWWGDDTPPTTLLFMHLWKCAGSSLRHLLRDWAKANGQDIGIVVRCSDAVSEEGATICLQEHALVDENLQAPIIRQKHVVAGHFTWGFQKHVTQPYVMFTTLRNPLELFVSGQQYLNRKVARRFDQAVPMVVETMRRSIANYETKGDVMMPEGSGNTKSVGFIYRLVDRPASKKKGGRRKALSKAAQEAKDHLDTFWLVGVVEQYAGFIAVLQAMVDPLQRERALWERYTMGRYNQSPQGSASLLAAINPTILEAFNNTLSHQWDIYSHAVDLYKHRCLQMLQHTGDIKLCEVPVAPAQYTLPELEQEELFQEMHPGVSPFNASEMIRAKNFWEEKKSVLRGRGIREIMVVFDENGFDVRDIEKRKRLAFRLGIRKRPA